jgi:transposase
MPEDHIAVPAPTGGPESPAPPKRGRGRPRTVTDLERARRFAEKEEKRKNRFSPRGKLTKGGHRRPFGPKEKQQATVEYATGMSVAEIADRHQATPHYIRAILLREFEKHGGKEEFEKTQKEALSLIAMRQVESLLNLQAQVDDSEFAELSYTDKHRILDMKSRFLRNVKGNEPANINVDNRQQLNVIAPERATRASWDSEVRRAALGTGGTT